MATCGRSVLPYMVAILVGVEAYDAEVTMVTVLQGPVFVTFLYVRFMRQHYLKFLREITTTYWRVLKVYRYDISHLSQPNSL